MVEWIFQYKNAPLYLDRYEALDEMSTSSSEEAITTTIEALKDPYYALRIKAINSLMTVSDGRKESLKTTMLDLAKSDEKSAVRSAAIKFLADAYGKDETTMAVFEDAIDDKAFSVVGAALRSINKIDKEKGVLSARKAERGAQSSLLYTISDILAENGDQSDWQFYVRAYTKITDFGSKYGFVSNVGNYLVNQPADIMDEGLGMIEEVTLNENAWFMRLAGAQSLANVNTEVLDRVSKAESGDMPSAELEALRSVKEKIKGIAAAAREKEDNPSVLAFLKNI